MIASLLPCHKALDRAVIALGTVCVSVRVCQLVVSPPACITLVSIRVRISLEGCLLHTSAQWTKSDPYCSTTAAAAVKLLHSSIPLLPSRALPPLQSCSHLDRYHQPSQRDCRTPARSCSPAHRRPPLCTKQSASCITSASSCRQVCRSRLSDGLLVVTR